MTVCLTGDVHHMSLKTRDQEYMDRTEVEAAIEYAEIAGKFNVPVTLFITGKAAKEEPEKVRRLATMDHVEIGGHNFWAFGTPLHKLFRGLLGTWHGPRWFQAWEIRKTINTFDDLGIKISSWRDHAYRYNKDTINLLKKSSITYFSNVVEPKGEVRIKNGVTVLPINTPPDHEHIYHGFRTPEFVSEDDFEGPFGTQSYDVGNWINWVLECAESNCREDRVSTILAHPACMSLVDEFDSFEILCTEINDRYDPTKVTRSTNI